MSTYTATAPSSRSSISSASSVSSAPSSSAWSPFLAHAHAHHHHHPRLCAMNPSANTSSLRAPSSSPTPAPASSIAALPSLAHSLSAFPNMTFVTNDMVHYGTLGRTKGASQAKLNSALRVTKQRQVSTAPPGALAMMSAPSPYTSADDEDPDPVLLLVTKRSKAKRSS